MGIYRPKSGIYRTGPLVIDHVQHRLSVEFVVPFLSAYGRTLLLIDRRRLAGGVPT